LQGLFMDCYRKNRSEGAYQLDSASVARRSLQNQSLSYLLTLKSPVNVTLALDQVERADNMTDRLAALSALVHSDFEAEREDVLQRFYEQWQHDNLVVNQWLGVQASASHEDTLDKVKSLMEHDAFDMKNPNKVR